MNNFFKHNDKVYSENLNDSVLVGNAFSWSISIDLPTDSDALFPASSDVVKAKVADVYATPNSNLSIGETITNNAGSSQVYRLTVYPNFNRFGGFTFVSLEGDGSVIITEKGGTSPVRNNLDYANLGNVTELKTLREYDLVVTIPVGGEVTGLGFGFKSSSADVTASINQSNVTGLNNTITAIQGKDTEQDGRLSLLEGTVNDLFDLVYPVGSIYMSVNSTSPQTLFGGTWERIQDKFLLASGTSYSNGSTGGSADAVVVSHTHTQQDHSHTNTDGNFVTSDVAGANNTRVDYSSNGNRMVDGIATTSSIFHHRPATSGTTAINNATGVSGTGKNMPPYIAVYVWKRTA